MLQIERNYCLFPQKLETLLQCTCTGSKLLVGKRLRGPSVERLWLLFVFFWGCQSGTAVGN